MAEAAKRIDKALERAGKVVTIVTPILIGVAGLIYTANKDKNDIAQRRAEAAHRELVDRADAEQKNIGNLLPLLKSDKDSERLLGIELFTQQAKRGEAPLDLLPTIERLRQAAPGQPIQAAVAQAQAAAVKQQETACRNMLPEGVYLHVDDKGLLGKANDLGNEMKARGLQVRGAQVVDVAPRTTEIRYYPASAKQEDLDKIAAVLGAHGVTPRKSDISYLLKGCTPRAVYEVWIGGDAEIK